MRGSPTEKSPKGTYYPFLCIQEKKKGLITRHCPLCDKVAELEAQLKVATDKGASKDQIKDFRTAQIMPIQADKKYYLNVINQEGKIGVLTISYTMFQDLEMRMKENDAKGIDLTGLDAPFLNFTVTKKYKGDQDAIHKADVYLQRGNDGRYGEIIHTLTPEIVNRLRTEARDLGKLFREIPVEAMAQLAAGDTLTRTGIIDRLIATSEPKRDTVHEESEDRPQGGALTTNLPGVNAMAVSNVEIKNGSLNVHTPSDLINGMARAAQPNPTAAPASAPASQPTPQAASKGGGLTDAEFMSMFGTKSN
jgi:hypothetical protein